MGRYSKLIAAVVGNLVAILVAWLATSIPAVAECAPAPDAVADAAAEVCTVLGFSQTQITAFLMTAVNAAFVYFFPPNSPPA